MPTEPALREEVNRTNIMIVHLTQQAGFVSWQNLYTIEVDHGNRNYYNYESFGHMARNCRNRGIGGRIGEERRLEYRNNRQRKMIEGENGQNQDTNLNGK